MIASVATDNWRAGWLLRRNYPRPENWPRRRSTHSLGCVAQAKVIRHLQVDE
jgi:hypothetical protein